jgi:hypothetical protein
LNHGYYPEVVLETSTPNVSIPNAVTTFFGLIQGQDELAYMSAIADVTASGTVTFTASVRNMVEECGDEFNPCIETTPLTFEVELE